MTPSLSRRLTARRATRGRVSAFRAFGAGLGCDCGDCPHIGGLAASIPAQRAAVATDPSGADAGAIVRA